jgi:hypothetical protein
VALNSTVLPPGAYGWIHDLRAVADGTATGKPQRKTLYRRKPNDIVQLGEIVGIVLRGRAGEQVALAIIDATDLPRAMLRTWYMKKDGYVRSNAPRPSVSLHRFILNAPDGYDVDHINHNTLDNRRTNLRIVTTAQNTWNSRRRKSGHLSSCRGVSTEPSRTRWNAVILVNGRRLSRWFKTEEEAIAQREAWEREFFGEFACRQGEVGE